MNALGATSRVVLGGTGAVSDTAANAARCVYPKTDEPLDTWATTGWRLADDVVPFADRPPVDVYNPTIELDETGLRIYLRIDTQRARRPPRGLRAIRPVGAPRVRPHRRPSWLASAVRHAEALVDMRVERDGAWWYPYVFKWTYYQRTLDAPWWSLMAQGEALSLYSRLATATSEPRLARGGRPHVGELPAGVRLARAVGLTGHRRPPLPRGVRLRQPSAPARGEHARLRDVRPLRLLASHRQCRGRPVLRRRSHDRARSDHAAGAGRGRGHELLRPGRVLPEPALAELALPPDLRLAAGTLAEITGDARFADWSALLASDWQPSPFEAARGYDFHFEPGVEPLEMGAIRP